MDKRLTISLFIYLFMNLNLIAGVTFTDYTNSDFNQSYLQNLEVSDNQVFLPNQATAFTSWVSTTNLPQQLEGHKITYWNNKIYLSGGYNGSQCSNKVYSAEVNSGLGGWSELESLPAAVQEHEIVAANGYLYVLGGKQDSIPSSDIYYAKLNEDGSINSWQLNTTSLPQNLWGHTAAFLEGFIYVIGGSNQVSKDSAVNKVYSAKVDYDGELGTFSEVTTLPEARSQHQMVTYGNTIYLLGGYNNSGVTQNSVFYAETDLNGSCSAWSNATALPDSISSFSACCNNGLLTVVGGIENTKNNNTFYANITNAPSLNWQSGTHYPFYVSNSEMVGIDDKIIVLGGYNNSEPEYSNECYYSNMITNSNRIKQGFLISQVMEFGNDRTIGHINYSMLDYTTGDYNIYYRTANEDGTFGSWINGSQNNPLNIGENKRYLQYMFKFHTDDFGSSISLYSVNVVIEGYTEIDGNLSGSINWTAAESPYWVTTDISLSTGLLMIEPGVEIIFSEGTGLTIQQAELYCVGTVSDSILFTSYDDEVGTWKGLHFTGSSDDGVASTMEFTIVEKGGYGDWDANLYCNHTITPNTAYCEFRKSSGNGVYLNNADVPFDYCNFAQNLASGLSVYDSDPDLLNSNAYGNAYGMHYATVNFSLPEGLNIYNNNVGAIAFEGGNISTDVIWPYYEGDYVVMGDVSVQKTNSFCRLTITAGNTIKFLKNAQLIIGNSYDNGGELFAEGTADSLITFTAANDSAGGWDGIYFNDASDHYTGQTSSLKNCLIEKGSSYNIYVRNTHAPVIDSCIIQNSLQKGLHISGSNIQISNLQSVNNGTYGIYYDNPSNLQPFTNITSVGDSLEGIVLESGRLSEDKYWSYFDGNYIILGNINVRKSNSYCRLTIAPGNNLKFAKESRLYVGNSSNDGGELFAEGTSDSLITFSALNDSTGGWDGIFLDNASDYYSGQLSSFKHCVVKQGNSYNLYFKNTDSPLMSSCLIKNSNDIGIKMLNSDVTIDDTDIIENQVGLSSDNSQAVFSNCNIMDNELYEVHVLNPNGYPAFTNCSIIGDNSYFAIEGGTQSIDRQWVYFQGEYLIMDDIYLIKSNDFCLLTIDAGNRLKFAKGAQLHLGNTSNDGGYLIAEGTSDSLITFTAQNDSIGGWDGIYFDNSSDYYSGQNSSLKYCTIEKGNAYNIYFYNTYSTDIDNCTIQNSAQKGMFVNNSNLNLSNLQFINNGTYGLYYNNPVYIQPFTNITSIGDSLQGIITAGGTINSDRYWSYFDGNYIILDDLHIRKANSYARLTIAPGNNIKLVKNAEIHIGNTSNDSGELVAEGTADSLITFSALNDSIGGWDGIYFNSSSDYYSGQYSKLKNCIIEQGSAYNIRFKGTNIPVVDSCIVRNALNKGIYNQDSGINISNTQILNNGSYGFYFTNPAYILPYENVVISGNAIDGIITEGGSISSNKLWSYQPSGYVLLGDITMQNSGSTCCLTIEPGNVIRADTGVQLKIGDDSNDGGSLIAEGSADSMITFTALNDSVGGWDGIYFANGSNYGSSSSAVKYCKIEKGSNYNVYCYNTNQPLFDHTTISNADGFGVQLNYASPQFIISRIINNNDYGIFIENNSNPVIGDTLNYTCDIFGNNVYDIYNNSDNQIKARYNYWNSADTTYISARIFDYYDSSSQGVVLYQPYECGSLFDNLPPTHFSLLTPAKNAVVSVPFPAFSWEESTDPEDGNISYQLLFTEDSTWNTYNVIDELNSTSYTMEDSLLGVKTIWWRVKAQDEYLYTMSNETRKFVLSLPPTIPEPIIPVNGDTLEADNYLIWLASTDNDSLDSVHHYEIQLDDNSDFSSPVIDDSISSFKETLVANREGYNNCYKSRFKSKYRNSISVKIGDLTVNENLNSSQVYFWRVRAVDNYGVAGDYSSGSNNFYYICGIELGPVENLTISIDGLNVVLNWSAMTEDMHGNTLDVSYYKIYQSETADFSGSVSVDMAGSNAFIFSNVLSYRDKYFYKVTAVIDSKDSLKEEIKPKAEKFK